MSEDAEQSPESGTYSNRIETDADNAFELKFAVDADKAADIEEWAHDEMRPDPHADARGGYAVTTLYLDTPRFDAFHDAPELAGTKYRVRRYANETLAYLERKVRRGDSVRKQRTAVAESDVARAADAHSDGWAGEWFRREIAGRAFGPVCRLAYRRAAFFGGDHEAFRITLDRDIVVARADGWSVRPVQGGKRVCDGLVVCELKFVDTMPAQLKHLIARFGLKPTSFSKYRRACRVEDLAGGESPHAL
ncbi:MAG: polyphosphate polymerase domain-containing protein [Planctomycetes bacterium]|nr:polyphosphate polymerase domain-containing protein [Planctomycetota bacterium]